MSVMTFIILNEQQKDEAEILNGVDAAVEGRLVDNPLAPPELRTYDDGDPAWVITARVLNDPPYERWLGSLSPLPRQILDTDMIFVPPPPE